MTPAAPEVQPVGDAADKPVDSIEEASRAEGAGHDQATVENSGDAEERLGSAVIPPNEVGLCLSVSITVTRTRPIETTSQTGRKLVLSSKNEHDCCRTCQ